MITGDIDNDIIWQLQRHFRFKTAIARFCGVPSQSLTYWEKVNHVPPEHVVKLAKETGIEPGRLNPFFDGLILKPIADPEQR